jgi:hypothetical protein
LAMFCEIISSLSLWADMPLALTFIPFINDICYSPFHRFPAV